MSKHDDHRSQRFIVVTDGPGPGKSLLLDSFERAAYARSVYAGRGVIQDQMAFGGHALPWHEPVAFTEQTLCWEMRSYHLATCTAGPVFFDRAVANVAIIGNFSAHPCQRT